MEKSHGKHALDAQAGGAGKTSEEAQSPSAEAAVDSETTDAPESVGKQAPASDGHNGTVSAESSSIEDESCPDATVPIAPQSSDEAASGFVSAGFDIAPKKKRRGGAKAAGITAGVLVVLVLVVYVAGALVFSSRFLPGTAVGDSDLSMKTDEEVAKLLNASIGDYQLDVIGNGFSYRVTGDDIDLKIDAGKIVSAIHGNQNAWEWPLLMLQSGHDETGLLSVSFSKELLDNGISEAVAQFNESATPPTDATIVYNEAAGKFEVTPETLGTQIDSEKVTAAADNAVEMLDYKVVLDENDLIQPGVLSSDEKLIEAAELASGMVSAKLTLVMGGETLSEIDGDTLSDFITINENFEVIFKEEEMNAWVHDLAYSFDTVGTERVFMRADGKQVVVPAGGVYGWEVDSEALKTAIIDGIKAGAVAEVQVPCVQEAAVYSGANQRDWGERYIDVDISEQHVRFYGDDGSIIWESDCITGKPDGSHDTVPGTWYVNNKESPSKLIGYENGVKQYETTVKYWMAFEYNGIGFHDATWQPSFGGSMYANGYGSHGCVNLSYDAAQSLYDIIEIGDVVVVHP